LHGVKQVVAALWLATGCSGGKPKQDRPILVERLVRDFAVDHDRNALYLLAYHDAALLRAPLQY
jgi:hypothetical protein